MVVVLVVALPHQRVSDVFKRDKVKVQRAIVTTSADDTEADKEVDERGDTNLFEECNDVIG